MRRVRYEKPNENFVPNPSLCREVVVAYDCLPVSFSSVEIVVLSFFIVVLCDGGSVEGSKQQYLSFPFLRVICAKRRPFLESHPATPTRSAQRGVARYYNSNLLGPVLRPSPGNKFELLFTCYFRGPEMFGLSTKPCDATRLTTESPFVHIVLTTQHPSLFVINVYPFKMSAASTLADGRQRSSRSGQVPT